MSDKHLAVETREGTQALKTLKDMGDGTFAEVVALIASQVGAMLVGSAQSSVFESTVVSGQSLSPAIDLGTYRAGRLGLPATITGTGAITFQVSTTSGGTYKDLYDKDGIEYKIASSAASRSYALNVSDFLSIRFLKVRFGTSGAPQAQGQDTIVTITALA